MHNSALILFDVERSPVSIGGKKGGRISDTHIREFYTALFLDTIQKFVSVPFARSIVYARTEERAELIRAAFPNAEIELQEGSDTQNRVRSAVEDTFGAGHKHVILAVSTVATVPVRVAECGFTLLDTFDDVVVIAPTTQGGYYFLGMRHPHDELLSIFDFESPTLYDDTVKLLSATETTLYILSTWRDIHSLQDIKGLWSDMNTLQSVREFLPRTEEFLLRVAPSLFANEEIV